MEPAGSATPRAPQLRCIKALFVHGHYRQCIQACREAVESDQQDALGQPLRHAVVTFYLGLAHDELARLMHNHSPTKLLAFHQAEQHYKSALDCFQEDNLAIAPRSETLRSQELKRYGQAPATPRQSSPSDNDDDYDPFNHASPSFTPQSGVSHTDESRRSSLHASPRLDVLRDVSSSDLGTDSSFNEIRSPTRTLERDVSSMSLLGEPANRPLQLTSALPRTVSGMALTGSIRLNRTTSEGLMRPIRPGSPPNAYQMPPRSPRTSNAASTSRLPKLKTRNLLETPKRLLPAAIDEVQPSSSPVSPLPWGETFSDISTVSPVSPITPYRSDDECYAASGSASGETSEIEGANERPEVEEKTRADLAALRTQIDTHLRLLNAARDRTLTAQAARSAERALVPGPTSGTPLPAIRGSLDGTAAFNSRPCSALSKHDSVMGDSRPGSLVKGQGKPIQFIGMSDRQRRIEAGRSRGWQRQKFDASKYRRLADEALAEL